MANKENKSDQATDPKKKVPVKRKKATPRKRRPRKAAEPVAEPAVEPVMTAEELRVNLSEVKDEFVKAVAEPVTRALGRYSQMARDGLAGLVSGFLGSKKRGG